LEIAVSVDFSDGSHLTQASATDPNAANCRNATEESDESQQQRWDTQSSQEFRHCCFARSTRRCAALGGQCADWTFRRDTRFSV
jgi:hypothetical protein